MVDGCSLYFRSSFHGFSSDAQRIIDGFSLDCRWMFVVCAIDVNGFSLDIRGIIDAFSLDGRWIFAVCTIEFQWLFGGSSKDRRLILAGCSEATR